MNTTIRSTPNHCLGRAVLTGAILVMGTAITRAETAYEALRTIGHKYGEASLERIVEIQGNPSAWTVSLLDPKSPVKLQEIRVRNSRIVKQSTRSSAGRSATPINLDELNLDSDGALETANRHLHQTILPNRVDYTLSTDANGNAPVWVVTLRDQPRGRERFLQIAANDGAILTSNAPGAPLTGIAEAKAATPPAEAVTAVRDERSIPAEATVASDQLRGEPSTQTVAVEEDAGDAIPNETLVDEQRPPVTKEFRTQRTSSRSKSRGISPPRIVEKVGGKVERKVRFVRRIIPF